MSYSHFVTMVRRSVSEADDRIQDLQTQNQLLCKNLRRAKERIQKLELENDKRVVELTARVCELLDERTEAIALLRRLHDQIKIPQSGCAKS